MVFRNAEFTGSGPGSGYPRTHASGGSPDRGALRGDRGRHGVGGEPGLAPSRSGDRRFAEPGLRRHRHRASRGGCTSSSRPGRIRVVERGRIRPATFLDVRSRVVSGGEQGLLGLAFAPDYTRSGTFYVNYTAAGDGANTVTRYRARDGRVLPGSARVILRIEDPYAEPQRWESCLRPRRQALGGDGRRRSGRRPREQGAEHGQPARQDAAPRRPSRPAEPGDRRARAPEPVALQLRPQDG